MGQTCTLELKTAHGKFSLHFLEAISSHKHKHLVEVTTHSTQKITVVVLLKLPLMMLLQRLDKGLPVNGILLIR
jgi:hypothetical protein